jgi:hypothetical protein
MLILNVFEPLWDDNMKESNQLTLKKQDNIDLNDI